MHRLARNKLIGLIIFWGTFAAAVGSVSYAAENEQPKLHTNEAYLKEATRSTSLAIDDPIAVFAFVLASLPAKVTVYPTENYYYFTFFHHGVRYAGNIRLAPGERDQGRVQFAYYKDTEEWTERVDRAATVVFFDKTHGVLVEKIEDLIYRVSYHDTHVVFALNDLSRVKPPQTAIAPDERFIGPIFDESGIRFFLLYNSKLKIFHYVLDETAPVADEFFASARTDRIVIGRRTGFAFYRDHRRDRKILIGVIARNSMVNNYFDGPFDQLPENFIRGEELRDAILDADPGVKGHIDRLGNFSDDQARYLIQPFMLYRKENELYRIDQCATSEKTRSYYRCFVVPQK